MSCSPLEEKYLPKYSLLALVMMNLSFALPGTRRGFTEERRPMGEIYVPGDGTGSYRRQRGLTKPDSRNKSI